METILAIDSGKHKSVFFEIDRSSLKTQCCTVGKHKKRAGVID